jgi:hypothetical protein
MDELFTRGHSSAAEVEDFHSLRPSHHAINVAGVDWLTARVIYAILLALTALRCNLRRDAHTMPDLFTAMTG